MPCSDTTPERPEQVVAEEIFQEIRDIALERISERNGERTVGRFDEPVSRVTKWVVEVVRHSEAHRGGDRGASSAVSGADRASGQSDSALLSRSNCFWKCPSFQFNSELCIERLSNY